MKISIIVPAYNAAPYIKRCIDSVLDSTKESIEVIVINDGSTDNTEEILLGYQERIRAVTTENQGSAAASRNYGLSMAQGDYILFLDADDYLSENAIDLLAKTQRETDADIIKFRYRWVFPNGDTKIVENQFTEYAVIEKHEFKEKLYPYFISGIRLNSVCTAMFKKEVLTGNRFRTDMAVAEDAVFSLGAYTKAKKVVILPDVLYQYYQTGMGLTGRGISVLTKYQCNFKFAKETASYLKAWDMDTLPTKIKVYMRPIALTFDKLKRIKQSKV